MSRTTECNVPAAALKWSVERAGVEFGMTHVTQRKLLAKNSAVPDADGLFTTKQITDAVFGGLNEEKLATQRQLTRRYELDNQVVEASVLNRAELEKVLAQVADAIQSRIMSSELSREFKEDVLRDLASVPLILEDVASRQSKIARNGNGKRPNGEENES